jgi:hypothetical protein
VEDEIISVVVKALLAHPRGAEIVSCLVVLGVVANVANGLLPTSSRAKPIVGWLARALDRSALTTQKDAPGTLKLLGTASPAPPQPTPVAVESKEGESSK